MVIKAMSSVLLLGHKPTIFPIKSNSPKVTQKMARKAFKKEKVTSKNKFNTFKSTAIKLLSHYFCISIG